MGCFGNDFRREQLTREAMDWREIHGRPCRLSHVQRECWWAALRSKPDKRKEALKEE